MFRQSGKFFAATLFVTASAVAPFSAQARDVTSPLDVVLADERRVEDRGRDQFRHPKATLEFIGVTRDMTVLEVGPGGGWYTRILMPLVAEDGKYMATNYSPEMRADPTDEQIESMNSWPERFTEAVTPWQADGQEIQTYTWGNIPAKKMSTVDAVLFFRALHGYAGQGKLDAVVEAAFDMVRPGGVVGVVQHRAKADAVDEYVDGSKGYLREADVVEAFERAGFMLAAKSEVNANAKDTADYDGGVWTLPPSARGGADYTPIGESDRMTLRFVKPAN